VAISGKRGVVGGGVEHGWKAVGKEMDGRENKQKKDRKLEGYGGNGKNYRGLKRGQIPSHFKVNSEALTWHHVFAFGC